MLPSIRHPEFFFDARARNASQSCHDECKFVLIWTAVYEFGHFDLRLSERRGFDLKKLLNEGIDDVFSTMVLLSSWVDSTFDEGGRSPAVNSGRCARLPSHPALVVAL